MGGEEWMGVGGGGVWSGWWWYNVHAMQHAVWLLQLGSTPTSLSVQKCQWRRFGGCRLHCAIKCKLDIKLIVMATVAIPPSLHPQALVLLLFIFVFGAFTGEMHTEFGWWTFTWFKSPAARREGSRINLQIEGEGPEEERENAKKKDRMKVHTSHLRCESAFCLHRCLQFAVTCSRPSWRC